MTNTLRRLLPGTLLLLGAFQLPAPAGVVNDFAGVIPAAREAALEARLREFERRTGNAVVVATVPTLGGESVEAYATALFNRWGVGKAGSDRGVLVLVAPNDRRARIEVGRGLEHRLPDAAARRIMDDQLLPRFRQGDFAGGIEAAVDALFAALGAPAPPLTAERPLEGPVPATAASPAAGRTPGAPAADRPYDPLPAVGGGFRAPSAAEDPRPSPAGADEGSGAGVGAVVALLAALAGAAWAGVRVRERRRRAALRRRLREQEIPARLAAGSQAARALEALCGRAAGLLPLAADQETITGAGGVIAAALREDEEELETARALIEEDPDAAAELLHRAEGRDRIHSLLRRLEGRIQSYQAALRGAPAAVEAARELLARAGAACDAAEREGFRAPREALAEAEAGLERARAAHAATPPDPEAAMQAAGAASALLRETTTRVSALPETRRRVEEALARLREAHARVAEQAAAAEAVVGTLRDRYPAGVWEEVAGEAAEVAGVLAAVAREAEAAERAGGMEVQDFALAERIALEAERTLTRAEAVTRKPAAVLAAQEEAEEALPRERSRAEAALREAVRACRDRDVERATRARLRTVSGAFEAIGPLDGPVDYVALLATVREVTRAASAIGDRARRETLDAEYERRRRDEEDDHASWSRRSSSRSSGSGSRSGSFGGGRSGGGGASGSW